ncbi:MAG: AAA family ATPase [Elusimicrobiota bacterium]|nr:MAG: AAA family ATPase [Elusimicrobiota bacterium]
MGPARRRRRRAEARQRRGRRRPPARRRGAARRVRGVSQARQEPRPRLGRGGPGLDRAREREARGLRGRAAAARKGAGPEARLPPRRDARGPRGALRRVVLGRAPAALHARAGRRPRARVARRPHGRRRRRRLRGSGGRGPHARVHRGAQGRRRRSPRARPGRPQEGRRPARLEGGPRGQARGARRPRARPRGGARRARAARAPGRARVRGAEAQDLSRVDPRSSVERAQRGLRRPRGRPRDPRRRPRGPRVGQGAGARVPGDPQEDGLQEGRDHRVHRPPGVGKTSIASAIAQALGRRFVRLSLGGVHDESVLRGHGRTYVGSMPGEILRQMKAAGTVNPVMLMDEVDKIGRNGANGDPTAALLEVLDPEQNSTFRDRYLDLPYDLSEVLFVVTSNDLSSIPAPLRDRMEIIEFDGYTTLEKLEIAERHVVPQKTAAAGLAPGETKLTRAALRRIIEGYTMEAGVRGLREKVETLLRKVSAWTETRGEPAPPVVDEGDVATYLGVERYSPRPTARNSVGVATGLSVSARGGSTLNVEVSQEPGTGRLLLRNQFGDDISDSAMNAYKYVKTHAAELGLAGFDFTKVDVDINITPAGKVDGPSAGGLMVTAIVSALTGRAVKDGVAMTGEITMRGDVLPIGGLKQKVMAAHRMGYAEVIFPAANLKDLESIPKEVRDGIKLTPARTYADIYPAALEP